MMPLGRRPARSPRRRRHTMGTEVMVKENGAEKGAETPATSTQEATPRQRPRRKPAFAMPQPAWPVKGLWEAATAEERAGAHRMGTLLFEHWLGRLSRKELAEKIGQPPVRVWQMSQQALAGLVVGLLKQPSQPPKGTPLPARKPSEEDPRQLRKALEEALRQKGILEDLVKVLKEFPSAPVGPPEAGTALTTRRRPGRPKGKKNRPTTAGDRRVAPSEPGTAPAS